MATELEQVIAMLERMGVKYGRADDMGNPPLEGPISETRLSLRAVGDPNCGPLLAFDTRGQLREISVWKV